MIKSSGHKGQSKMQATNLRRENREGSERVIKDDGKCHMVYDGVLE